MLTSSDVLRASFTSTSFRRGYDEFEVDEFLDELVETLRYYEQGGQPVRGGDPAYPASSDPEPLDGPTPSEPEAPASGADPETAAPASGADPETAAPESGRHSEPAAPETAAPAQPLVPDVTDTPARSALPVMVSATSRKYIERAQRASRWLREEPLS